MPPHSASPSATAVLITSDHVLLDAVRSLAAAAGVEVVHLPADQPPGRRWALAGMALIGADLPPDRLPGRRDQTVVVGTAGSGTRLAACLGAEVLDLPDQADRLCTLLAQLTPARQGLVVGVLGAAGGCGATTLSWAVAQACAGVLVDADPLGGVLGVWLGLESDPGLRWPAVIGADGPLHVQRLVDLLPSSAGIGLLGAGTDDAPYDDAPFDRALAAVLSLARREVPVAVVALPPGHDLTATLRWRLLDAVVLVVPDEGGPVLRARQVHRLVTPIVPVGLCVRTRHRRGIGRVAVEHALGLDAVAVLTHHRGLQAATTAGDLAYAAARGPLRVAACAVRDWLGLAS